METKEFVKELDKTIEQIEDAILQFEIKKEEIAAAVYELINQTES